jgi:hypothetical protein
MQLAAPHQPAGDVGRLQRRAFGRRMRGKIACDRNEDMSASVSITPGSELSNSRLQHLIGMQRIVSLLHCPSLAGNARNSKAVGHVETGGFAFIPDQYLGSVFTRCRTGRENPSLARCDQQSIRSRTGPQVRLRDNGTRAENIAKLPELVRKS